MKKLGFIVKEEKSKRKEKVRKRRGWKSVNEYLKKKTRGKQKTEKNRPRLVDHREFRNYILSKKNKSLKERSEIEYIKQ